MHLYLKCVWFNGKEYDLTNKIWLLQEYNADANLNSKCYSSSIWTVDILTLHTEYCTTSLGSRDDHKKVSTYVNVGIIVPRPTTFMEKNSIFIPFGYTVHNLSHRNDLSPRNQYFNIIWRITYRKFLPI